MTADQKLTPQVLWTRTVEFVGNVLPGNTDMKTLNKVAIDVYEQMKFLLEST